MTNEQVLDEVVRAWAIEKLAGDVNGVEHAVVIARAAYAATGSVTRSCAEAREFMRSWTLHPAHVRADRPRSILRLVS